MSFYEQKDQKVFMVPESAALTPLNGTLIVANPTTYPWYSRLNILPDGLDWDMPIQKKEKVHDVGSGKHPDHIFNTEMEPIEFSMDMMHQDARFLALATGTTTSASNTQKEVQVITLDTYSDYADGDQFLLYFLESNHVVCYQVYMDVTGDDSGKPAAIVGATATRIDWVTGDGSNNQTTTSITSQATLGAEIEAVLEALTGVTGVDDAAGVTITYNTVAEAGAVPKPRDLIGNTGITTFSTTTNGASTHTVTEQTANTMKTFGLHIEYNNGSEDIVVDLMGCVVKSYEITIDYEEKIVKETVGIMCPYYIVGLMSLLYPPVRTNMDPAIFADLKEDTAQYVIMVGTADRTPAILNTLTLSIENDVEYYPEIGVNYRLLAVNGKREVKMNLVGFTQTNDIWENWKDTWSDALKYYTNAGGKLNSEIEINREDTYDNWLISIENWMIEEYDLRVIPIDDKILHIDVTFTGASPATQGAALIDSLVVKDYVEKLVYGTANA